MVLTLTVRGTNDGFGSQYLARICGYAFCQYPENNKKYVYVHTPMTKMEHCQKGKKLSDFIGIPYKEKWPKVDKEKAKVSEPYHYPNLYFTGEVLSKIRDWYYSTNKPSIDSMKQYQVCIHIRRGDIADGTYKSKGKEIYKKYLNRYYLDDKNYINMIHQLRKKYPLAKIAVFSEGKSYQFDFLEPEKNNITLFLNSDLRFTFHCMVEANILVTGKSTLSYTAALLNKYQNIYYIDFMCKPLKNWKILTI